MSIRLTAGQAHAVLLPSRGGLLSELELTSKRGERRKILWLPNDFAPQGDMWPGGGAPLLFPFAGRVFHEGQAFQYQLEDKVLPMPLHGFAHTMPWQVVAQSSAHALLQLEANAKTRAMYPFDFVLRAHYQLTSTALQLDVEVINRSVHASAMPIALGWHPYFCTANAQSEPILKTSARQKIPVLSNGAAGSAQAINHKPDGPVTVAPITQSGLANLILGDLAEPHTDLINTESGEGIRITGMPKHLCRYVVLWSRDTSAFFCIEPWMGLPDAVNNGQGLICLEAGKSLHLHFGISTEI